MKSLHAFILTTCILTNILAAKAEKTTQKNSKTVTISIDPQPTVDMQVNIGISGKIAINQKLDNAIITPDTKDIMVTVTKPIVGDDVEFYIFPLKLHKYVSKPKTKRKNYNVNSELKQSGEDRLLQALSTSVKYSYDKLPQRIKLPNPMIILQELLDCSC